MKTISVVCNDRAPGAMAMCLLDQEGIKRGWLYALEENRETITAKAMNAHKRHFS